MQPRFTMTPIRLMFSLLLPLTLTVSACGSEAPPPSPTPDPVTVETAVAALSSRAGLRTYSGTIQGGQRIPLATKMMGTVTRLDVEVGDRVQAGQTLVRVRSQNVRAQKRQVEARLRDARAALQNARINFERIRSLREKDSATQKELDDAHTAYQRAQARVEALRSRLDEINDTLAYATLASPIDGFVVAKRAEEGELAAPGQPLVVVESLEELEAVVQVPESDVNRFQVGDSVTVEIGAAGNATRPGVVAQINPAGSDGSRQFDVQVRVLGDVAAGPSPQTEGAIKSGMYARVLYPVESGEQLTVPEQALVRRGQLIGLFTVSDSTAMLRWVRTGEVRNGRVEVLTGLRPGETYVADATPRILDGQRIRTP